MHSLENILKEIKKELKEKEEVHETAQKEMRRATSLSKQAILFAHEGKMKEARRLITEAQTIIRRLDTLATVHSSIVHSGLFNAALQEYAEATIFLKLIEQQKFATPDEIKVPSVDYVLGLADVIGEYRRLTLDALREGDVRKAERCLKTMDEIFMELMAMEEAYMLVPGLRRKCDVARKIIEATRGDVTMEARRNALEQHLKRLEKSSKKP